MFSWHDRPSRSPAPLSEVCSLDTDRRAETSPVFKGLPSSAVSGPKVPVRLDVVVSDLSFIGPKVPVMTVLSASCVAPLPFSGPKVPVGLGSQAFGHPLAVWASGGWLHTHPLLFKVGQLWERPQLPGHELRRWKAWQNSTPFGFRRAQLEGHPCGDLSPLPGLPFLPGLPLLPLAFPLPLPFGLPLYSF